MPIVTQYHRDNEARRRRDAECLAIQKRATERRLKDATDTAGVRQDAWSGPVRSAEAARNRMIQGRR